ncbi:MAG: DUF4258 domain-containing protein [Candidatus Rokubacteria bacterium]|nr:DUF4258 domain-containing protein [Candidatus Rokubacteria bacterium]
MPDTDVLFEVGTPLGFAVRVTRARWELITTIKHPVMAGREASVRLALESPDEVRQSRTDPGVLLFYKAEGARRWVCAVAKQAPDQAFLVTAYPTDAIKEGMRVWPN